MSHLLMICSWYRQERVASHRYPLAALVLVAALTLSGCATYDSGFYSQSYQQPSDIGASEVRQEAIDILSVLLEDMYIPMSSLPYSLCRSEDGYFIANIENGEITSAAYLGSDTQKVIDSLVGIKCQQEEARALERSQQLNRAIALSILMGAQSIRDYSTSDDSSYAPKPIYGLSQQQVLDAQRARSGQPSLSVPTPKPTTPVSVPESSQPRVFGVYDNSGNRVGYARQNESAELVSVFDSNGKYIGTAQPYGGPVFRNGERTGYVVK